MSRARLYNLYSSADMPASLIAVSWPALPSRLRDAEQSYGKRRPMRRNPYSANIFAPLFCACSRVSIAPSSLLPSPITKPSLSLSKGLEAFSGSSFLYREGLYAAESGQPKRRYGRLAPPVTITSASPCIKHPHRVADGVIR